MFENLSERLAHATGALRGKGRLSEDNIKDTLRQVRVALLEADVALPVVKQFIGDIRERAVGTEVTRSLTPGQALTRIIHDELVRVMGESCKDLDLRAQPPVTVLLAGLQGSGKTTTAAKLARWLAEKHGKRVMLGSADVYRPAAVLQLERLADAIGAGFWRGESQDPVELARGVVAEARRQSSDVVILDTAGRGHGDEAMMAEGRALHEAIQPHETLVVVDSMAGQDAVNAARAFAGALPLTGVILTKADGDARGGAALSVRTVTGQPIKFIGVGEKTDALEPFHPDRIASCILGMGDVMSLVEEVEQKVDRAKAEKLAKKLKRGKGFDLQDLKEQLQQMLEMGGLGALMEKLPLGLPGSGALRAAQPGEGDLKIAIIGSMTLRERRFPKIISGPRRRRIASGSGTQVQDVNRLLKQFTQMQKVMKKMSRGGMGRMLKGFKGLPGVGPRH